MRWPWLGVLVALAASGAARAEPKLYENVRVDAGLTGSTVSISDRNGTGMAVEIKGLATDNLSFGGRVEFAVMFGGVVGTDEAPLDITMAACGLLKAEYVFGTATVRPFVGLGAGGYTIGSQTIAAGPDRDGISTTTGRYVGIAPQLGIDLGPVRLAATYNAILGAYLELHQRIGAVDETRRLSQNYLSIELSYRFAGGRLSPAAPAPQAASRPAPQPQPQSSGAGLPSQ